MFIFRIIARIRFLFTRKLDKKTEILLADIASGFSPVLESFMDHYVSNRELEAIKEKWQSTYRSARTKWIPQSHPRYHAMQSFLNAYPVLDKIVLEYNKDFVVAEKERYAGLFSDIDGKSLDDQQRTVVVTGEDYNLVLAGAGSGKTLTISGKVKYLCEAKGVNPEDILLIAFTRKASDEMKNRINGKLGIAVDTFTFHKLGLSIISSAKNEKPDVADSLKQYVSTYLTNIIVNKAEEIKLLIEYFAYYLKIPADLDMFESLGDAYDYERGADFETLQSKYEQARYVGDAEKNGLFQRQTLKHEKVKSLAEVEIANFLFLNGVNYEYEAKYRFPTSDSTHRVYRPDFYLPDYDIYIEHFGIDRNGELPWLSPIEADIYKEGMKWKREVHAQNNTCLLETYSYYSSEGRLLPELEKMLVSQGVVFNVPDFKDIFNTIYSEAGEKYFSEFIELCSTFITLFKSRGYRIEELDTLHYPGSERLTPFYRERTRLFLSIIKPILIQYNEHLNAEGSVDFSDMINEATELVNSGFRVHQYKWVIIDEYQDISVSRFNLVKAILDQTGAKLLCVGDDWQSIYRFAGSDISLFTKFSQYFQRPQILRLEQTYRNSQQLIDIAGSFIMRNKNQYHKDLRSDKHLDYPIVFLCYLDYSIAIVQRVIDRIILEHGPYGSILLLGRTRHDAEILKHVEQFHYNESTGEVVYSLSPETKITFLTVHKAKGLEADNVVLLNFKNYILGFPNKISDDPLLGLVLTDADEYSYAEERRLLYVALTRAKEKIYILVDDVVPSEFYKEFAANPQVEVVHEESDYDRERISCPRCKTGHLVIRRNSHDNRDFLGCSNYPRCDFTVSDTAIIREKRKCPSCGGFLVKRKGISEFYGCSNYPHCFYKQSISN